MTVLDIDPPPTLRLVSTNGQAAAGISRYRASAPLYGPARNLYRHVLQHCLGQKRPIDADALRVVLATRQGTSAASAREFTASSIWQLMFVDVVAWCRNRQLDVPVGCATALIRVVEYLDETGTFAVRSDTPQELFDAIDECTGGWVDEPVPARSNAHRSLPSTRGPKRT